MIMAAICDKNLPVKPDSLDPKEERLWELCERCWNHVPVRRPSAEGSIISISILQDPQVKSSSNDNSDNSSAVTVVEHSLGNFWYHQCSLRTK